MRSRGVRLVARPLILGASLWGLDRLMKSDRTGARKWGRILAVGLAVLVVADATQNAVQLSR